MEKINPPAAGFLLQRGFKGGPKGAAKRAGDSGRAGGGGGAGAPAAGASPAQKLTASALQHLGPATRSPALEAFTSREGPDCQSAAKSGAAYWGSGGFKVSRAAGDRGGVAGVAGVAGVVWGGGGFKVSRAGDNGGAAGAAGAADVTGVALVTKEASQASQA